MLVDVCLQSGYSFEALNIYLAALSFCNFDKTPIINSDTTFVDCARIVPCCDYIFYNIKQAKKEEVCMEAKSKFGTRHVNIDGNHSTAPLFENDLNCIPRAAVHESHPFHARFSGIYSFKFQSRAVQC